MMIASALSTHRSPKAFWLGIGLAMLFSASGAFGARVYYVNQPERTLTVSGQGVVMSVNLDGTNPVPVWSAPVATDLRGIATDVARDRLYVAYCELDAAGAATQVSLRWRPMVGGDWAVITSLPSGPAGAPFNPISDVEYDPINDWIYYSTSGARTLNRIKPDGTQGGVVLTHIGAMSGPYFFGLDPASDMVYWGVVTTSGNTNTPYSRGNVVTGVVDTAFSLVTVSRTRDIAVDPTVPGGRLYWCDRQEGNVYTRLAAGGPVVATRPRRTFNAPHGLALDTTAGKAYMADTGKRGDNPPEASAHGVARFNLDSTGPVDVLSPPDITAEPWDLALDLTSTSYVDWKTRFFSAADTTTSQPTADPDGDGLTNLAEYGFFTHPLRADAHGIAILAQSSGIRFAQRRASASTWRVEVSTDLVNWRYNGDATGLTWSVESSPTDRDEDSVWISTQAGPALMGSGRAYFRVRIL